MESDRSEFDFQNIADLLHRSPFSEHLQHFALPAGEILWAIHRLRVPDKLLLPGTSDLRGYVRNSPNYVANRLQKLGRLGVFQQVSRGADAQGLCGQIP